MAKAVNMMAKTFKLAYLLNYQDGAVVSREIIKQDAGTVTLFAFDKGQGLSEHTAPFDALVYIVDGNAQIRIAGKSNVVKRGEMIIMPAHKAHSLQAIRRFKMLLVMVKKLNSASTAGLYAQPKHRG